jgi:hypothetical protein
LKKVLRIVQGENLNWNLCRQLGIGTTAIKSSWLTGILQSSLLGVMICCIRVWYISTQISYFYFTVCALEVMLTP